MAREKIEVARDADGNEIMKGDTVATLGDNTAARVADLCIDDDMDLEYVRLKPLHQAYGKGLWHSADRVIRLSATKRKTEEEKQKEAAEKAAKANGAKNNGEKAGKTAVEAAPMVKSKSGSKKKSSKTKVGKKK
jgi:hypothetical protein